MVNYPSVAVLLAAYNGKQYIQEQMDSLFNQEEVTLQLFISVDLSTDGTYEWCKRLENNNKNITVLEYGERFGGAGKNFYRLIRDVDFTEYDFVALADQDDIWLQNKLSRAVHCINEQKVSAYSSDVMAFWENGLKKLVKKSYPQKTYDYLFEAAGPGCTYVFKRSVILEFKKFMSRHSAAIDQVDSHDWMLYAFCRSRKISWFIDDKPMMLYRQHNTNQVGFNSGFKAYLKRISMVKNHWYRSEVEKIITLVMPANFTDFLLNRWFLVKNFWELRRRKRDALALLLMTVLRVF